MSARRFDGGATVLSLFAVLAGAKVLTLVGRGLPLSVWTPLAYFWQDALVAVLFGIVEASVKRAWVTWTLNLPPLAGKCYTWKTAMTWMPLWAPSKKPKPSWARESRL